MIFADIIFAVNLETMSANCRQNTEKDKNNPSTVVINNWGIVSKSL